MKTRLVVLLAVMTITATACGDDSGSVLGTATSTTAAAQGSTTTMAPATSQATTTTSSPPTTTTTTTTIAAGACPGTGVGAIPAAATNLTSTTGDFDGNGALDTFSVYGDGGDWYAHFTLSTGYNSRAVIDQGVHMTGAPGNGIDIIADRTSDLNTDGREEVWLFDTTPAARIILSAYAFVESTCQPFHLTHHDTGMTGAPQATWLEGASGSGEDGICFIPNGLVEYHADASGVVTDPLEIIEHSFIYDDAIPAAEFYFSQFIDPAVGVPNCVDPVLSDLGFITAMTPSGVDFDLTFDPVIWEPQGPGTCGTGAPCFDNPTVDAVPYFMPDIAPASYFVWDSTGNLIEEPGFAFNLSDYLFGSYCNGTNCLPGGITVLFRIIHDGAGTILSVSPQYVP